MEEGDKGDDSTANRYLFVSVGYDPALDRNAAAEAPETPESEPSAKDKPSDSEAAATTASPEKQAEHAKRASELQQRFAPWFYVISDSSFKTIHKDRDDLFKDE